MKKQKKKKQEIEGKEIGRLIKAYAEKVEPSSQLTDEIVKNIIESTEPAEIDDDQLRLFLSAVQKGYQDRVRGPINTPVAEEATCSSSMKNDKEAGSRDLKQGTNSSVVPTKAPESWGKRIVLWDPRVIFHSRPIWLLAGALLIIIGFPPTQQAWLGYVKPPEEAHQSRSREEGENALLDDADDPSDASYYEDADHLSAAYQLGINSLLEAQFWIFNRGDGHKVDAGIHHLDEARAIAEKIGNQPWMAECYFYLGKAYLKKKDLVQARHQFDKVMALTDSSDTVLNIRSEAEKIRNRLGGKD